jgi:hypothetical protein
MEYMRSGKELLIEQKFEFPENWPDFDAIEG